MRRTLAALAGATLVALALAPAATAKTSCDPLDKRACLLPWPNNSFTEKNAKTDTGRQLALNAAQFPKNVGGTPGFPTDLNRSDGFSPGAAMLTFVPGLDLKRTGAVPQTDLRIGLDTNQPIVVIDAKTRKRQLVWAELDTQAESARDRLLMIHPAKNLAEGRRYIVALRNLRDARGRILKPGRAFRALRDGTRSSDRAVNRRRSAYKDIFKTLGRAGVARSSLYLAWDFTVASERNISERVLSMRDDAFAQLGDDNLVDRTVKGTAPKFSVDAVQEFAPCGADGCQDGENDNLARKVTGTITVPCYLDRAGCPTGSKFAFQKQKKGRFTWVPKRLANNTIAAKFFCTIPRAALAKPARISLYGHGLLGDPDEIMAGNVQAMAQEHDFVFCATAEIGMAEEDVPNAIAILRDMSKFASLADRLQQGMINGLYLGRLMLHPQGLVTNAAFRGDGGGPAIDTGALFYDSNSQGGIFGGALTALAPDFQRAVLGVPGMNYSLLLPRSVDFDTYEAIFKPAYPKRFDRLLLLNAIQGLWDRGEGDGYALHMTGNPLANTPLHQVLLHVGLGDHQVAQVSAEVEARTIGAVVRRPAYDAGRSQDKLPFYGITPAGDLELGSAVVVWDSGPIRDGGALGTDLAPLGPAPPRTGNDPHELVRRTVDARRQKSEFLKVDGRLVDTCPTERACHTDGWPY